MKKSIKLSCAVLSLFLLTACTGPDNQRGISKQGGGAVLGALAGGVLGSAFGKGEGRMLAVGAGALLGAYAGSTIGKSLDEQDKLIAERASQKSLELTPVGTQTAWKNPDSGHSGTITPTRTYKTNEGRYCREFTQEIYIGGQKEKAYGTACRQSDGHWQIISDN